jgi:zona occludens toxin (predicted ATPase)
MSIIAYTGLPRSGKSYTAVEQVIVPAIQKGRVVVTNLALKKDALLRDYPGAQIRELQLSGIEADPPSIFDLCPNGAVVVIDECWRLWPAGKKVDKIPEAFKSFLAEHGHRVDVSGNAQHIVLVTQDLAQIAAFARQLVELTFVTRKLTSVGLSKKFRTDVYQGHPTGISPPESQRIRQIFGTYQAKVYQYYTSHTMSEAGEGAVNESAVDRRGNVLLRPVVLFAPVLVIALVGFGVYQLRESHSQLHAGASARAAVGGGGAAPVAHLPIGPYASDAGLGASSRKRAAGWWVTATFEGSGELAGAAWLTDGDSRVWVELSSCRRLKWHRFACPHDGAYWTEDGERLPADQGPLAVPVSARKGGSGAR